MQTSSAGLQLIKQFEGCRLQSYVCPAGVLTIGWGHTSAAGKPKVVPHMDITQQYADAILINDLVKFEAGIERILKQPLEQHQFDALVSFAYNCGLGALEKSTLFKRVNAGELDRVPAEFMKWTKAGGKELPGLVRRRRAEAAMWRSVNETAQINHDEARAAPDAPKPSKSIIQSKEANVAAVAGLGSSVAVANDIVPHISTLSEALGRPTTIILICITVACAAIWYWRRQRLQEEGA